MSHVLVGKTIINMQIADDKKALRFLISDVTEEIVARADGDCCSNTWIEHVQLPPLGFPAFVLSVSDIESTAERVEYEYGDVIEPYALCIKTDKGDIHIEYRNESNGFYGGNLTWPEDYHYGGVHGQNNSTMSWEEIVEV